MRIRHCLPLFFILAMLLAACQQGESPSPAQKLAVVDLERILRESEPAKAADKFLLDQQQALQDKLVAVQAKLEKDPKDEAAQKELQSLYASAQQRLQAEMQNVQTTLMDVVQRSVNAFREQKGYDVIFNANPAITASFSPSADVTAAVIAKVNEEKVEFKPLPEPPAAPAQPEGATSPVKDGDSEAAKAEPKEEAGQK